MLELLHEYALLIAVALPATVVVAMNLYLLLAGERGTLVLPSSGEFPAVHPHLAMLPDEDMIAAGEAVAADAAALRKAA